MRNPRDKAYSPERLRAELKRSDIVPTARFNMQNKLFVILAAKEQKRAFAQAMKTIEEEDLLSTASHHSFSPVHLDVVAPEQAGMTPEQASDLARIRQEVEMLHAAKDDYGLTA